MAEKKLKKVKINHLYDYRFINMFSEDNDGKQALIQVKQADKAENKYFADLWLLRDHKLTKLAERRELGNYFWDFENRVLFTDYQTKEDKELQESGASVFYRWDLQGGLPQRAFSIPFAVIGLTALDAERFLVAGNFNRRQPKDLYLEKVSERKKFYAAQKERNFMTEYRCLPFYMNGAGDVDGDYKRLFIYNQKTEKLLPLTSDDLNVEGFELNNDKDVVLFWTSEREECCSFQNKLWRLPLNKNLKKSPKAELLFAPTGIHQFLSAKELNNEIYVVSSVEGDYGLNQSMIMHKLVAGKLVDCIKEQFSIGVSVGSDIIGGGRQIRWQKRAGEPIMRFLRTERYHSSICSFDGSEVKVEYTTSDGAMTGFVMLDDQTYVVATRQAQLSEIYLLGKDLEQVTHFNDAALKGCYVARPELVQFKYQPLRTEYNPYGLKSEINVSEPKYRSPYQQDDLIDGFVLLPQNFDPEKKYPAILDIHGGPRTVYGDVFFHEMQVWVNMGYVVMFCNPRGGDGRGDDFADIRGKYGHEDYQDIMDFVDVVLEKYPNIDRDRLGVTGGSYGGFMTNWIVGHTDRFACAATQRSISNWISFYGVSDIGYYFGLDQNYCDTESEEGWQKLWLHSPLRYVNSVKTPLLFIHSDQDYRCPLEQALQFYSAIKHRGVDSKICIYHGENHDLSRSGKPHGRISRLEEITGWFEKYLTVTKKVK